MSTPFVIKGQALSALLARSIARREAREERGWRRRHDRTRVRQFIWQALAIAAVVGFICIAVLLAFLFFQP